MSALFVFEIKDAKKAKILNYLTAIKFYLNLFKQPFLHKGWSYGYDFWHVFRDQCETSKKYDFAIFSQNIAKVITI